MKETMTDIYAMRRANGDWFALEDHGRVRVPLFQSRHDAMMARLRNFGMLLFDPVPLDAQSVGEITASGVGSDTDFCIVEDPFGSLRRSPRIATAQLASLIRNSGEQKSGSGN